MGSGGAGTEGIGSDRELDPNTHYNLVPSCHLSVHDDTLPLPSLFVIALGGTTISAARTQRSRNDWRTWRVRATIHISVLQDKRCCCNADSGTRRYSAPGMLVQVIALQSNPPEAETHRADEDADADVHWQHSQGQVGR